MTFLITMVTLLDVKLSGLARFANQRLGFGGHCVGSGGPGSSHFGSGGLTGRVCQWVSQD